MNVQPFSTSKPVERGIQQLSKIENYDSSTYKTLAFYKFHKFTKPELEAFRTQLLTDLGEFGIVGRIYISTEGVNAQIACPEECLEKLEEYRKNVLNPMFDNNLMELNIGTEHGKRSFRALHVRIRKQLIVDGLDSSTYDLDNEPSHLSPAEWHERLSTYETQHGEKPILIDMRNHYESKIGYFDGAICPDADTYKDSIDAMNEICENLPRDQEIFMYCTGGIRCTKAGAILQSASKFNTVHLVEGGITSYGRWVSEQEDKESLFRGKNFTFDARMGEKITDEVIEHFEPSGAVMVDGVRVFMKQGEKDMDASSKRVVIGKKGVRCDHEHTRRTRAIEILGQPGEILKEWAKAGRDLPPKPVQL
ncbi:Rhodanese-like domain-containing protein [Mucor mucedo]|uniref:Rhodanese-like domain-containing protein n=1 Tax=Mucor mucedo TaxID=29922 RepID=UPI002220452F|nr:Rhodanese-like domain-containing protein [Mucor mucedo]KAI7890834.1 Rhodanese-like domain-containing protein [Mucor mucedo]